ncbi:MAG TPA: tRNA (adenosine(37)-N6)-threonylcarbamoyltransferase complex dimerization subunit type 1 TsaB [Synechococcus sp. M44_DOE_062]|nr:tRNA (adenosine(37)-N6)-threonylcarbamoyltransferase complex dimerization subunit type 1 TsaB [Synechococcus sp. M44_DOE_062]
MPTPQWILGIHTTTPVLGLALLPLEPGLGETRSQSWWLDREMAAQLHPCLKDFLAGQAWSQIAGIAVALGPGSFTGSRLGVSVARLLGQQLRLPVFGYSALAVLARHVWIWQGSPTQPLTVAVQMDAKRGEWYGGVYQVGPEHLVAAVADQLWEEEAWQATLRAWSPALSVDAADFVDPAPVVALAELACADFQAGLRPQWQEVLPLYGRQPPIDLRGLN